MGIDPMLLRSTQRALRRRAVRCHLVEPFADGRDRIAVYREDARYHERQYTDDEDMAYIIGLKLGD